MTVMLCEWEGWGTTRNVYGHSLQQGGWIEPSSLSRKGGKQRGTPVLNVLRKWLEDYLNVT